MPFFTTPWTLSARPGLQFLSQPRTWCSACSRGTQVGAHACESVHLLGVRSEGGVERRGGHAPPCVHMVSFNKPSKVCPSALSSNTHPKNAWL